MSTTAKPTDEPMPRLEGYRRGNILEFYAEEFRPEPAPVELFRQHLIQWFFAAKHLRYFEVIRLTDKPMPEDLASHRMVCSALISFGEFAASFCKQFKGQVDLPSVGLSVECIESETRLLQNNLRMFHDHTMSRSEADAVLREAFHET